MRAFLREMAGPQPLVKRRIPICSHTSSHNGHLWTRRVLPPLPHTSFPTRMQHVAELLKLRE
jgi:hypothetical protein